jgi:hypothetical protein
VGERHAEAARRAGDDGDPVVESEAFEDGHCSARSHLCIVFKYVAFMQSIAMYITIAPSGSVLRS